MVETLTPAGCGGHHRRIVAVLLFTLASVAAASALGGVLGFVGALAGHRPVLIGVAACLAVLLALRECGVLPLRIPDLRRQVPERWRRTLPMPVWATGYGAILGSGFGTYQPAGTYWATVGMVTAVGRPMTGAVCMGMFGLARGVMVVVPGGRLLDRFADAHRAIRPINALVLIAVAIAAIPTAAAAQGAPLANGMSDPSVFDGNVAYTRWIDGVPQVEVKARDGKVYVFPDARMPSLYGSRLAYEDAAGIRLVNWATGAEIRRVRGDVSRPAVYRAWLGFVRASPFANRLQVVQTGTGRLRTIVRISPHTELGRPSIFGTTIAWHQTDGGGHVIYKQRISGGRRVVVASGARRYLVRDPALGYRRTAWMYSDAEFTSIWVRNSRGQARVVATAVGPEFIFTTMSIGKGRILVTRWNLLTAEAAIQSIRLINI